VQQISRALTDVEASLFKAEIRRGTKTVYRITSGIPALGFAGMALVDPYLASGNDLEFALFSRIVVIAFFLIGFAASFFGQWVERYGRVATHVNCLVTGGEIILLAYLTGGGDSSYHEGLHVTMYAFALLPMPWGRWDAAFLFSALLVAYNVLLIAGDRTGTAGQFATRESMILLTVVVGVVCQRLLNGGRLRDFLSRRAMLDANERLKALDDAKSRFFANLSHELRTPLTLIVAPIEATLDSTREPLGPAQTERLSLARRNALRLLRLVDDLLALTRAEAAALEAKLAPVDACGLIEELHRDVEALASRKNITVEMAVEEGLPPILADRELADRVLLNLIGNAAKFVSVGGKIVIGARRDADMIEVFVQDDGPGIAEADLTRVFDRFYQADGTATRRTGGTGIGLALVREIMELHGGRAAAESVVGQGATLRCWFPIATVEPSLLALDGPGRENREVVLLEGGRTGLPGWHDAIRTARSYRYLGIDDATERRIAPRPRPRGDAPTVLVVEDNADMVRFIVALMAVEYNVFAAQNGVDALRILADRQPDIIISDVMMPGMDGFEFVRRVRAMPETCTIPFIFLSARGAAEDRVLGHSGGADAYLAKPFKSEELLAAVESLLSRQESVRSSSSSREEEALVFLASGVVDVLRETRESVAALEDGLESAPALREELDATRERLLRLETSLGCLASAGVGPAVDHGNVAQVVQELAATRRRGEGSPRIDVQIDAADLPRAVFSSAELHSILNPLLDRALATSPAGARVKIRVSRSEDRAFIAIRDDGPPMTAMMAEHFFFPFRTNPFDEDDGLALAIARRLLRARRGEIAIEPQVGMGNEVRVFVPLMRIAAEAA